jgi:hypothetical protein
MGAKHKTYNISLTKAELFAIAHAGVEFKPETDYRNFSKEQLASSQERAVLKMKQAYFDGEFDEGETP